MAADHVVPGSERLPKAWTRGRKWRKSCQKEGDVKRLLQHRSNESKSILSRIITGAARIFNSFNSEDKRAYKKTLSVAGKTREDTASATEKRASFNGYWQKLCVE